jgi:hypothetical protein
LKRRASERIWVRIIKFRFFAQQVTQARDACPSTFGWRSSVAQRLARAAHLSVLSARRCLSQGQCWRTTLRMASALLHPIRRWGSGSPSGDAVHVYYDEALAAPHPEPVEGPALGSVIPACDWSRRGFDSLAVYRTAVGLASRPERF